MGVTAQRKDISDPDVVYEFARKVGDLVHLDYLYVLTVADINATSTLWNSWRASLLRQLYAETKRALRRGLNNPVEKQDWIDETRDAAMKMLTEQDHDPRAIESLWANIGTNTSCGCRTSPGIPKPCWTGKIRTTHWC